MPSPIIGYLDRSAARKVAALLEAGGIAVLPTDTIYGFHCAASQGGSVERIRRLKGRAGKAGFILLAADFEMACGLVAFWPGESKKVLSALWPAPFTAILPARKGFPRILSPGGAVAVRVPAHGGLRSLIAALGEPIVSTSVNVSGREPMTAIAEIMRTFPGLAAYCSQRGRPSSSPSTVVDFTVRPARVVRSGTFAWPVAGGYQGERIVTDDE